MTCFKCKNEIPDESVFCPRCGNRLTEMAVKDEENVFQTKRNGRKWIIIILVVAVCIALLATAGIFIAKRLGLSKNIEQFQTLLETQEYEEALKYYELHESQADFVEKADKDVKERYEKAVEEQDDKLEVALFNSGLLSQDYIKEVEKTVKTEIDGIKERYFEEGGTARGFRGEVKKYLDYENETIAGMVDDANKEMKVLLPSRAAYRNGEKAEGEKDYGKALEAYSKVIENDAKYNDAQSRIKEIVPLYKKEVMKHVEKNVKNSEFDPAVAELKTLKKYCSDSDVASKLEEVGQQKAVYDEEKRKLEAQQYKDSQEVEVVSAQTVDEGYYIKLLKGQVILQNNSDKVVKDVDVALLYFDANGYPVRNPYALFTTKNDNLAQTTYETCNIQPGGTYGSQWVIDIPSQCSKLKACVKRVTYVDTGLTWENPYYEYWLEDNQAAY